MVFFSPPIPKGVLIGCGLGCRKLALVDYLVVCGNAQILPLTTWSFFQPSQKDAVDIVDITTLTSSTTHSIIACTN